MQDLERLKKIAWKEVDAVVPRFLMRPLSIRITCLLLRTRVAPDHVTISSFALKLLAAQLFLFNMYLLNITAGTLLYFSHVLDCVDGELARAKNQIRRSSGLLDYFLDRLSDILVYTCVTLALYNSTRDEMMLFVGIIVLTSTLFMHVVNEHAKALKAAAGVKGVVGARGSYYFGLSGIELILLVASVLNKLPEGMLSIGILTAVFTFVRFVEAYISIRKREFTHQKPVDTGCPD